MQRLQVIYPSDDTVCLSQFYSFVIVFAALRVYALSGKNRVLPAAVIILLMGPRVIDSVREYFLLHPVGINKYTGRQCPWNSCGQLGYSSLLYESPSELRTGLQVCMLASSLYYTTEIENFA